MDKPKVHKAWYVAMVLAVLFFGVLCATIWNFQIDDSYITYRFGLRLANEGNLAWNHDDAPVEGYTSFTSVIISAISLKLHLDPIYFWKILNILLVLLAAFSLFKTAKIYVDAKKAKSWISFVPPLLFLFNPYTALHAMSGMDTMLFTALIILSVQCFFHIIYERKQNMLPLLSIILVFVGLTRPEGMVFGLLVMIVALFFVVKQTKSILKTIPSILLFILPLAAYMFWRILYFHDVLPNTFYAKAFHTGGILGFFPSLFIVGFFSLWHVIAYLIIALLFVIMQKRKAFDFAKKELPLIFMIIILFIMIAAFTKTLFLMGYGYRFLYPFFQLIPLLLFLPLSLFLFAQAKKYAKFCIVAVIIIPFLFNFAYGQYEINRLYAGSNINTDTYRAIGLALNAESVKGTYFSVYHHNMGSLMYYASTWDSVDAVGLLDAVIAKKGFSPEYVLSKKPTLLMLPSLSTREITVYRAEHIQDMSQVICNSTQITAYTYLGYFQSSADSQPIHFFLIKSAEKLNKGMAERIIKKLTLKKDAEACKTI